MRSRFPEIKIDWTFAVYISALILLLPIRLGLSWLLAIFVHECSHFIALRFLGVDILSVRLQQFGVFMDTAPMTKRQEFLSAMAGPFGGLSLLLVARWIPCAAICAFLQSLYNLLPIYPMDGGRAIRCALIKVFGDTTGKCLSIAIHHITFALLGLMALFATWKLNINLSGILILMTLYVLIMRRKLPCKHKKLIVQ